MISLLNGITKQRKMKRNEFAKTTIECIECKGGFLVFTNAESVLFAIRHHLKGNSIRSCLYCDFILMSEMKTKKNKEDLIKYARRLM